MEDYSLSVANPINSGVSSLPLCVDLDGSLIKTDTLYEMVCVLLKTNFWCVFLLPFWLRKGKANLKYEITSRVSINPATLPYDENVLNTLKEKKKEKRRLYLVTGCNEKLANEIADHVGLFDGVYASSENLNLTGNNKSKFLIDTFGEKQFDYLGNERADFPVWEHSNESLVVSNASFFSDVNSRLQNTTLIPRPSASLKTYIKAIRVHQWVKNFLIFIPLLLNSNVFDHGPLFSAIGAFFAFSLMASATYILNDLLDLESDRVHHKKKYRAFASGDIGILRGVVVGAILFAISLCILLFLPVEFAIVSFVYLISTLLYSFHIKTMIILDTCVLAGLFTIRVVGGTAAIGAEWSFWLLAFSMFFFLSLAFTKRASELHAMALAGKKNAKGRGYKVGDKEMVTSMGIASGYIGVLVIALYINGDKVISNYNTPYLLWLVCPLLLYWIGRIWMKTTRGEMNEDPIVFALKDKISYITAALCALVVFLATFDW